MAAHPAAEADSSTTPIAVPDYAASPANADSAVAAEPNIPSDKSKPKQTDVRLAKPASDAEGE